MPSMYFVCYCLLAVHRSILEDLSREQSYLAFLDGQIHDHYRTSSAPDHVSCFVQLATTLTPVYALDARSTDKCSVFELGENVLMPTNHRQITCDVGNPANFQPPHTRRGRCRRRPSTSTAHPSPYRGSSCWSGSSRGALGCFVAV